MKTDELREKYLEFFVSKGCTMRPSDVLVPRWDPSVLFTPAGMNQFKDHFLGKCKLEYTRATSCQKCLRTGDIDNVGRTAYHHTFFEMLGNFSFGDYFKREAIAWAWEFLTSKKWLGIDGNRLTVTVYLDDDEAADIWHKEIGLATNRITRMGEDDNFWPAGAPTSGPDGVCGPCSEIYFHPDKGSEVEIWNLVFTQFNRVGDPPNNLRPLPSKNIDTGMGLERCAATLQGVDTNYHIDSLRPIVEAAAEICGKKYVPGDDNGRRLRRIADHVRACAFAMHENVYPGPRKQEYVIRRLLRRAVLDGRQMGVREPFLHQLTGIVAEMMKKPYPELAESVDRVSQVMRGEEEDFFAKIDAGLQRIERVFADMESKGVVMVPGNDAFDMYQTFGFPPELFETLAAERNFSFDWNGYKASMDDHGLKSSSDKKVELFKTGPLDALKKVMHGTTFLGYETTESKATVKGIIAQDKLCETLTEVGHKDAVAVVLDQSPFYGESGGQVGDSGELIGDGFRFEVTDTHRDGEFILHLGHLREGSLKLGAALTAKVDVARRQGIRRAHSATHILHHALQKYVGTHALQRGSKVDRDWLRFDFTNNGAVDRETLTKIEAEVNERIISADPVSWQVTPIADARKAGAMMLFGEKYPDMVRMVTMGDFSRELCGGTHLTNTGQVGLFKILSEEGISTGTRRITAATGLGALERVRQNEHALAEIASALKAPVAEAPARVATLAKEVRELKKQLSSAATSGEVSPEKLLEGATKVGEASFVVAETAGADANVMRQLIDQMRRKASPIAVLLASTAEGKVTIVAGISRELEALGLHAGNWVGETAQLVGGKGGGKSDMAQAGGKEPEKLPAALESAKASIKKQLAGKV